MSVAATRRELDKVKFEAKRGLGREKEQDSGSDTESDVSAETGSPVYYPDAIKWARFRNSKKDRGEAGFKGWHYGVMWGGYLKSWSDTEEYLAMFDVDDQGHNQLIEDFWTAAGRPMSWDKEHEKRVEPKGRLGEIVYPTEDLMKRWLAEARPRRSYKLFKIREKKEKAGQKIEKRDSDYYWYKDLKAKAKLKAEREAALIAAGEAGPSKLSKIAKKPSSTSKSTTVGGEKDEGEERKAKERKVKAGSASLGALFEDDAKAKAEAEKRQKQMIALFSEDEEDNTNKAAKSSDAKKGKRKAGSRTPDVDSTKGSHRSSPQKKQKIPTPTPATTTSSVTAPIPIPSRSNSATNNASQLSVSPSNGMSVPQSSEAPKDKEPLFLDGEASPIDTTSRRLSPVDTFGAPLPGIFFKPTYMSDQSNEPEVKPDTARLAKTSSPSVPTSRAPSPAEVAPGSVRPSPVPPDTVAPSAPAGSGDKPTAADTVAPVTINVIAPTPRAFVKMPQAAPPASTELEEQAADNVAVSSAPPPNAISPVPQVAVPADNDKARTSPGPITATPSSPNAPHDTDVAMPSPRAESPLPTSPGPAPLSPPPVESLPTAKSASISPPRYDHSPKSPTLLLSPVKSDPKSLSPTSSRSPVKFSIPLADRPKYVQPKLVKVLDAIVDPEAEARRKKMAARKGSHPSPAHPTLPARPSTIVPPTDYQPRPPSSAPPRSPPKPPSPIHPTDRSSSGPQSAPLQPKRWGQQPPAGPSAMQARPSPTHGPGHLPDQKDAFKSNKLQAPWVQRQQNAGLSPSMPYPNASPAWNGSGGTSPLVHTDRWTPVAPTPPQMPNRTPQWAPSHNNPQPPPGFPGHRPTYPSAPPQAIDPRSASASPLIHNASPMGPMGNQTPISQAADPRRGMPPQTPLQSAPPRSPNDRSSASGSRRIDNLGKLALRLDYQDHVHHLSVSRGAYAGQMADGDAVLSQLLGAGQDEVSMGMDDVDLSLVQWQIKQFGARVVQWAKLGCPDTDKARRGQWEKVKTQSHNQGKAWVAYTELPYPDDSVTAHYALIVTDSNNVRAELLRPGLGLGPWASTKEAGVALIVLALPLDSVEAPMLPDPVRPDAVDFDLDIKPKQDMAFDQMHLLASYGLTPEYFASLSGRPAVTYPPKDGDYDILKIMTEREYQFHGVKPHDAGSLPDHVLFDNAKMGRAVKSTTVRHTVNRRTQYFAAGPSLHLLPSQWGLREIWRTGGLVTFSPTFILRNPTKFSEIMQIIRTGTDWAAYVIPELVQWVETSWKKPTRCPQPTEAYQAFSKALVLDHHLLHISGSKACSGGGLAISTCPPLNSEIDKCASWLDWLARMNSQTDYKALVKLCFENATNTRDPAIPKKAEMGMDVDMDAGEVELNLDLVDIETKQIEDLTHLRMRPHCVPYRRFIYIGDVSLGTEKRNKLATGIECVDPDSFAALLSGAI